MKTWCYHMASLQSSDTTHIPSPDTPCNRCHHPNQNWFCLSCKDVFCGRNANSCFRDHYKRKKHCLAINCGDKSMWCLSCLKFLQDQEVQQLRAKVRLAEIDAMIGDVIDLLSKPSSSIRQDELSLAKQGLQSIFDGGLKSLADPQVQEEFLLYSATFLSADSCPLDLKLNLSSFASNLSLETSAFAKAQEELKAGLVLSASVSHKKFVLRQQASKFYEAKEEIITADEKICNLKAKKKELEAEIKRLDACLAAEESNRAKIDEVIFSIETQVSTTRNGLVSDLAQVSSLEGSAQAANQLVAKRQLAWDNLKTSFAFTKFAIA